MQKKIQRKYEVPEIVASGGRKHKRANKSEYSLPLIVSICAESAIYILLHAPINSGKVLDPIQSIQKYFYTDPNQKTAIMEIGDSSSCLFIKSVFQATLKSFQSVNTANHLDFSEISNLHSKILYHQRLNGMQVHLNTLMAGFEKGKPTLISFDPIGSQSEKLAISYGISSDSLAPVIENLYSKIKMQMPWKTSELLTNSEALQMLEQIAENVETLGEVAFSKDKCVLVSISPNKPITYTSFLPKEDR